MAGPESLAAMAHEETPDLYGAYPSLGEGHIAMLKGPGETRRVEVGDVLYREADRSYDFVVILAGKVAIVEGYGTPDENVVGIHGPQRFLGEISLLTGQAAFVTAVVLQAGEVLIVPVERLREIVLEDTGLGDLILRAYLLRRSMLIEGGVGFRIVGSCYSSDTSRLREFAVRNRLPHRFIDLDKDAGAEDLLRHLGHGPSATPVVIWRDCVLRNPSNAELARLIGLPSAEPTWHVYDLVVIGAGPAGLAAAVYSASEGLSTIVLDSIATGGQAGLSARIENYLGFPAGLSGAELAERALLQAEKFGAEFCIPAESAELAEHLGLHEVRTTDGATFRAHAVVIATGARYRRLDVPGLERFENTSVYYAATLVEGHMCVGAPVVVVGGGNSAGQAAVFLARRASKVHLVARKDDLGRDMSRYLVDRLERTSGIEIMLETEVRQLDGDGVLRRVEVEHMRTGEREWLDARALFVFIGAEPHTRWLDGAAATDEHGFILAGPEDVASVTDLDGTPRRPLLFETTRAGVFAVGDVRSGSVKRVASAVGEGSMVVRLIHEYLGEIVGPTEERGASISQPPISQQPASSTS